MVLPVHPNPITLNDIQTEFGGANPIRISEYYNGGSILFPGVVGYPGGTATLIPSSGTVKFSNFHGAQKPAVRAIFGYGQIQAGTQYNISNLVSTTGVMATDSTGVGTARHNLAGAGYGGDKAIFGFGRVGALGNATAITNLVSNTGVVADDTTGVGQVRIGLAAASYGKDKAIFAFGSTTQGGRFSVSNLVSNTGVVATNTTGVGTARGDLAAAGYGGDKAIFGYGMNAASEVSNLTNLVSNTGVVATDTTGVGTARLFLHGVSYGGDKALFVYGQEGTAGFSALNIANLVSNTGVVAGDTSTAGTARSAGAAAGYGGDKAVIGFGGTGINSFGQILGTTSQYRLVSNLAVVGTNITGVGTARILPAGASYATS
jgi:hypothetical protein